MRDAHKRRNAAKKRNRSDNERKTSPLHIGDNAGRDFEHQQPKEKPSLQHHRLGKTHPTVFRKKWHQHAGNQMQTGTELIRIQFSDICFWPLQCQDFSPFFSRFYIPAPSIAWRAQTKKPAMARAYAISGMPNFLARMSSKLPRPSICSGTCLP